jgi:acetylornithine deacetylase/succinyl-diaminopimelate desuccinylase-like protein
MISQAQREELHRYLDDHFDETVAEIRRYLSQPGFSHTGEGIRQSAEMTRRYLEDVGSDDVELVETGGHPVVFGHLRSRRQEARSLIVYSHYDMVPLMDERQWVGPPLQAPIVDAADIGAPAELGKVIVGRAANDYRGPLVATLHALRALRAVTGDVPVDVVWVIDGEEEIGAPHLHRFVEAKLADLQRCEALWMPGMHQDAAGVMQVYRGYKGNSKIEIEIKGGRHGGTLDAKESWAANLHWMDAPMWRMVRLLATLVDDDDLVTVDRLAELIAPYTEEDEQQLRVLRERLDEGRLKASLNIARFKKGRDPRQLLENFVMQPTLNVVGILGGYTGPGVYSTLPMDVVAKVELRFPPAITFADVKRLLRAHLDRRGYEDAELRFLGGYEYARSSAQEGIYRAAFRACRRHGCDYVVWPIKPAGAPFAHFNRPPLEKPVIFVGMGHGDRWHQPNEYITLDGVRDHMRYVATFLEEWSEGVDDG